MSELNFKDYDTKDFLDEMFDDKGKIRDYYVTFSDRIAELGWEKVKVLQHATERAQLSYGMTFNVYSDNQGAERILHLDIIPRIIAGKEWETIEKGLKQRIKAINLFIADIYSDQKILKDKIIPEELILSSAG